MLLEYPGDCVFIRLISHRHLDWFRKVLNKNEDVSLNVKQKKLKWYAKGKSSVSKLASSPSSSLVFSGV